MDLEIIEWKDFHVKGGQGARSSETILEEMIGKVSYQMWS